MAEQNKPKIINESKFVKSYFNQDYFLWHTAQEFENKYIAEMMEQNVNDDCSNRMANVGFIIFIIYWK
ncbi:hypothetical protein, partial [Mycoplasmopsis bovis]|uniref:hypothetical protein n=1 Tax=Mycoplasmopsis bovis TaxID=28903 RepID=UPI003D2C408E